MRLILALWLLAAPAFAWASAPAPALFAAKPYVLDQLSSYPAVAYSVRQLTGGQYLPAYDMTVRRSSDNATANIGFSGGVLNVAQLTSFCAATNCYVVTWKNQGSLGLSGDATQSTAAFQPQIVASGVVQTQNGQPAIRFLGNLGASFLNVPAGVNPIGTQSSWINVVAQESSANVAVLIFTGSSYLRGLFYNGSQFSLYYPPTSQGNGGSVFSGNAIATATFSSTSPSVNLYRNGTNVFSVNSTLNGDNPGAIRFGQGVSSAYWQTNVQEAIYGLSNLSTPDRITFELSQAAFYNIAGVTQ